MMGKSLSHVTYIVNTNYILGKRVEDMPTKVEYSGDLFSSDKTAHATVHLPNGEIIKID